MINVEISSTYGWTIYVDHKKTELTHLSTVNENLVRGMYYGNVEKVKTALARGADQTLQINGMTLAEYNQQDVRACRQPAIQALAELFE